MVRNLGHGLAQNPQFLTTKIKGEFNLTDEALKKTFSLPHFQFKILNSTLHEFEIIQNLVHCRLSMFFLQRESETVQHFFYDCSYSISFWKDFEVYYLSLTKQQIHLNLKDILIGLLTPELPLLNYLLLIAKIYLWVCRRNKELPSIRGFKSKSKVKLKYETEKHICIKNNNLDMFRKKWAI